MVGDAAHGIPELPLTAPAPGLEPHDHARRQHGEGSRVYSSLILPPIDCELMPYGICPVNPTRIEVDPVARFVRWHNTEWPHMSLNMDVEETPEMAFKRKTPPPGSDVTDE